MPTAQTQTHAIQCGHCAKLACSRAHSAKCRETYRPFFGVALVILKLRRTFQTDNMHDSSHGSTHLMWWAIFLLPSSLGPVTKTRSFACGVGRGSSCREFAFVSEANPENEVGGVRLFALSQQTQSGQAWGRRSCARPSRPPTLARRSDRAEHEVHSTGGRLPGVGRLELHTAMPLS